MITLLLYLIVRLMYLGRIELLVFLIVMQIDYGRCLIHPCNDRIAFYKNTLVSSTTLPRIKLVRISVIKKWYGTRISPMPVRTFVFIYYNNYLKKSRTSLFFFMIFIRLRLLLLKNSCLYKDTAFSSIILDLRRSIITLLD